MTYIYNHACHNLSEVDLRGASCTPCTFADAPCMGLRTAGTSPTYLFYWTHRTCLIQQHWEVLQNSTSHDVVGRVLQNSKSNNVVGTCHGMSNMQVLEYQQTCHGMSLHQTDMSPKLTGSATPSNMQASEYQRTCHGMSLHVN